MKSVLFILILSILSMGGVYAVEISIDKIDSPAAVVSARRIPGQLPDSRIEVGNFTVWLGGATSRYRHGILGDQLEASRLFLEMKDGRRFFFELPDNRVFEDLQPRLADLDKDGIDEILVIESDKQLGSSLAIFSVDDGEIVRKASTPFIGRSNRWLNPVGVGDFDGDGNTDIALVSTPHIGGVLKLYKLSGSELTQFAAYSNVSTHSIGSTELGLGQIVTGETHDLLLLPDQSHEVLSLLEWTPTGIKEIKRLKLPDRLKSSLVPVGENRWTVRIADGNYFEITIIDD